MDDVRALLAAVQQTQEDIRATQGTILERLDALEACQDTSSTVQTSLTDKIETVGRMVEHLQRKVHRSAGTELLGIFELAEPILLQLDEPTTLGLQRFSQVKSIIDGSNRLQRKIFQSCEIPAQPELPAAPDLRELHRHWIHMNQMVLWKGYEERDHRFFNSLRPALARDGYGYRLVLHAGHEFPSSTGEQMELPKLLKLYQVRHWFSNAAPGGSYIWLRFEMLSAPTKQFAIEEGFLQPEERDLGEGVQESWQRMFVAQPPLVEIRWDAVDVTKPFRKITEKEVVHHGRVPPGVTFGGLLSEGKRLGWHGHPPKPTYAEAVKKLH